MRKWPHEICPIIFEKLQDLKGKGEQYIVDLDFHTYTCRGWDLKGFPCVHGIVAMHYLGKKQVEEFVSSIYSKETYMRCYENILQPINGQELW